MRCEYCQAPATTRDMLWLRCCEQHKRDVSDKQKKAIMTARQEIEHNELARPKK
jgi:hypothetical protein